MTNPFLDRQKARGHGGAGRSAERKTATRASARLTPGSGALQGAKGDIGVSTQSRDLLLENKTTKSDSITIQRGWLNKISQEALEDGGKTPALSIQFVRANGDPVPRGKWVMVPESVLYELLGDEK